MDVLDARSATLAAVLAVVALGAFAALGLGSTLAGDWATAAAGTVALVGGLVLIAALLGFARAENGRRTPYW